MTRAYVPLPHGLSATTWRQRYDRGEVPDASPYGLHKLSGHGVDVTFGETSLNGIPERVARALRHRTGGLEILEGLYQTRARSLRNADVVLTYDERTGVPAALLPARHRAPVVFGLGWITTRSSVPEVQAALVSRALPRAAAVWSQCAPVLPMIERDWGVKPSRLHFVPLGIDSDFYPEQPAPAVPDVIVSAGEDRYRDHQLLVSAVSLLRSRHPRIRLELATGLPVDLPADLGLLHRERLDGKMRNLYREASVVAIAVKPTLSGSGFTVALEAMASGRPVVMTNNHGISDYVEHGVTGLLVPPNDIEAFAAAISTLLSEPEQRMEMGAAAAARVRQRFTSDLMAAELAAVIANI